MKLLILTVIILCSGYLNHLDNKAVTYAKETNQSINTIYSESH